MRPSIRPVVTLALLAALGAAATPAAFPSTAARESATRPSDELRALDGEWVYVEDRTEGRALEQQGPPMSALFSLRVEEGAVVLVRGHGSGHQDVRVALDGSITEVAEEGKVARYSGAWKDGSFRYQTEFVRLPEEKPGTVIRKEFRITTDGLLVRVAVGAATAEGAVALYRHPQDIPMPAPAAAVIGDLEWLAGAWVGTRGSGGAISMEERWSPPLGGSMLGVSRTVSRGRMSAFEYLRIVERDGGLVYVAQPGGAAPTEFVLSERSATRAVFDNPRHDYPKRIVYELTADGALQATIGFLKGGSPRRFEFRREQG